MVKPGGLRHDVARCLPTLQLRCCTGLAAAALLGAVLDLSCDGLAG